LLVKHNNNEKYIAWNNDSIRQLRNMLCLTQQELANELGTRQQTISEWETGMYQPRGTSAKLLSIIAERNHFKYVAGLKTEPK
jgi:DNA-binding transcriptional regulator YiaG